MRVKFGVLQSFLGGAGIVRCHYVSPMCENLEMAGSVLRFGIYEFDVATMELRREGSLVRLQAQPKLALAYLLEHAGQTVSRDELCRAIWGNDTHVDFERGLNFCISQVRTALRDDPAKPVYIRTLPKEGYCFIAPVTRSSTESQPSPPLPMAASRAMGHKPAIATAIVLIAVASFLGGYWLRTAHASTKPLPILAVMRFDNETGNSDLARFSDNLTDSVVERLTAAGQDHYAVIGNAAILRVPREQWDLPAAAQQLHAHYIVVGQVQAHGDELRILAHLIRLPDQTHIWVDRVDVQVHRSAADPLAAQAEIAQKIAADFAPRIAADQQHPLPQFGSR